MQSDLWLDVLAGSMAAMLWAAGTLWMRRLWIEHRHPMAMICLICFLSVAAFLIMSRLTYWAAQQHAPIVSALQ
jgi:drug/metabolite transporter (DMT)-like permease